MSTRLLNNYIQLAKDINSVSPKEWLPPSEGAEAKNQNIIYSVLVTNTRTYIEKISNQINGCYENGWYDACSVMIRRLLETLIIEVFEYHNLQNKIKKGGVHSGDYLYLRDLITITLNETAWTLSRNAKSSLPKLKDIGDKSAHSRRFNAVRNDIDELKPDIRIIIQELLSISRLK